MQIATIAKQAENVQTGRFGKRSVLQLNVNGTIEKVWSDADDKNLFSLNVGESVEVERIGKSFKIIKMINSFKVDKELIQTEKQKNAERAFYKTLDKQAKKQIIKEIEMQTNIFATCLNNVYENKRISEYEFSDENIRAIATTIYIKVTKPI